jgi:tRNA(Ile2) C34 agmatinyltransferase TiaS
MAKRPGEKRDFMQVAREVVERAIGENIDGSPLEKPVDSRDSRYVALGSKGGKVGGKARAKSLRRAIAKKAAKPRWHKS